MTNYYNDPSSYLFTILFAGLLVASVKTLASSVVDAYTSHVCQEVARRLIASEDYKQAKAESVASTKLIAGLMYKNFRQARTDNPFMRALNKAITQARMQKYLEEQNRLAMTKDFVTLVTEEARERTACG